MIIPKKIKIYGCLILSILLYVFVSFGLDRSDFYVLFSCYTFLFFFYYKLIQNPEINFKYLAISSIILRLSFAWSLPNLSQDFYRFIWDGRLLAQGINPFINLPIDLIANANFKMNQATDLVSKMGSLSANHFSNYPPINQLFFAIAGFFSNNSILGSVLIFRVIIILADLGTLYFGRKLLQNLGLNPNQIFWYLLNPLVILELSGSLHFEGVMLFFLVWSLYLLHNEKWKTAAFIFGISVGVKLIPLLFLPLLYQKLKFKKTVVFSSIVIVLNIATFLPFLSHKLITNYSQTIGLYFTNFEFNAGLYYIARTIGYSFRGYNEIHIIGKYIPLVVILFVAFLTFFTKVKTTIELFNAFLLAITIYYFTATTVHPWYITTLLLLTVFTKFKYPFYWSYVLILSYFAYSNVVFKENMVLIFIEYFVVFVVFGFGIKQRFFQKNKFIV